MPQFRSKYDTAHLIELVGAVARQLRPDEPEALKKREFDEARGALAERDVPKADSILRRVPGFSWREIVQLALDPTRGREHAIAHRHREPSGPPLTTDDAIACLRGVRRRRPNGRFAPGVYDRERRRLMEHDRRKRHRSQVSWPTSHQISRLFDGWENALRAAGIELAAIKRPQLPRVRGVDWTDALDIAVEVWGAYPGQNELEQAMRTLAIPLARRRLPSAEHRQELRAQRRAEGKTTPDLPERGSARPDYATLPAGGLTPELERRIDALRGGQKRRRRRWSDDELIAALVQFLDHLSAGAAASTRRYASYQAEHPELPRLSRYESKGRRFSEFLDRARKRRRQPSSTDAPPS